LCRVLDKYKNERVTNARTKDTPSQADRANICDILCKLQIGWGHGTNALIPDMKYEDKHSTATNNRLVIAATSVLPDIRSVTAACFLAMWSSDRPRGW
jgi:hypothetical protein